MSLEYKPSLGFVETAGLVIAIQVADAMAKAAEVEIISAHKVDGLRVCVICKGDVAAWSGRRGNRRPARPEPQRPERVQHHPQPR